MLKKLILAAAMLYAMQGMAQKKDKKTSTPTVDAAGKKDSASALAPKPYEKVITGKAVTRKGMFTVHEVENKYYFEIPDSLLGREILLVTRISKAPADGAKKGKYYAGDDLAERVVLFEKGPDDKLFMRDVSYKIYSADSTDDGMYRSVLNSSLKPILAAFPIKAYNKQAPASVIEVTSLALDDNGVLACPAGAKKSLEIGSLQKDRSYIEHMKPFSGNVEVRTVRTYAYSKSGGSTGDILADLFSGSSALALTFEMNNSFVLLPEKPMKPREGDERVGYFMTGYVDFDKKPQGVEETYMITRWRLEPKPGDMEKYRRGELVEPQKPIVFYIDPTTPKKWVPYLIQGINDWQVAFEQAGFKNAIVGKEAPVNDSTWSLEDASHSAIVYKPSPIANASGPSIVDPRSGEILESHVNWYHNVMAVLHQWYFIQAGPLDPRARKMELDDELMGQLIRFVSSHEIGHTLGLMHNFGSSSTVPVDSLRNKSWVEAHGHTPSIMDYARFNYVAQPEDNIGEKGLFPRVNDYDKWAIEWGYRLLPEQVNTAQKEETFLNKWIIDSLNSNHRLWYGPQRLFGEIDPRSQSEDLGDDAMKASSYGIKNLQRIVPKLQEWTHVPNKGHSNLRNMYSAVVSQYKRYSMHVVNNIGGWYIERKAVEQPGGAFEPTPANLQQRALAWLNDEVFTQPKWLDRPEISEKIEPPGSGSLVLKANEKVMKELLVSQRLMFLIEAAERFGEKNVYTCKAFLNDLRKGIWKELGSPAPISSYRRAMQNAHIEGLANILKPKDPELPPEYKQLMALLKAFQPKIKDDLIIIVRAHLTALKKSITAAIPATTDTMSKEHLKWAAEKITIALDTDTD